MFDGFLTILVFSPAVIALSLLITNKIFNSEKIIRNISIFGSVFTFVFSLVAFLNYDTDLGGIQFVDYYENWIPLNSLKTSYLLGIDGLSAPLVLLTGLLGMISVLASWRVNIRITEYYFWLLLLQSAVLGVFTSLDMILFFVFFEFELIPMFMLISIWGSGRSHYSAMKFVLFTAMGGVFLLIGILIIYMSDPITSMAMVSVPSVGIDQGIPDMIAGYNLIAPTVLVFILFLIAFLVKLPVWPLHNWLPDAHTDAPTAVSIMLAGVLLKMAGYGLLRINVGFFQETNDFTIMSAAPYLATLAAISTIYGAIVTIRQTDMKRLIAFSSVSHMGYVLLGISIFSYNIGNGVVIAGMSGAALQMFTHGTITGLAFLVIGLIYDRTHTRYIPHLGGLWKKTPIISVFFLLAGFASLGLPGTSGFISEIMIFISTFKVWPIQTTVAAFGIVLAAGYSLWMIQRVIFGNVPSKGGLSKKNYDSLEDANWKDIIPLVSLVIPILMLGIWPKILVDIFEKGISSVIR